MVARHSSGLAFDDVRGVVVLAGGSLSGDIGIDDTWELVDTAVPTVSEWALIVMMMLLIAAGTVVFRGRRRAVG